MRLLVAAVAVAAAVVLALAYGSGPPDSTEVVDEGHGAAATTEVGRVGCDNGPYFGTCQRL